MNTKVLVSLVVIVLGAVIWLTHTDHEQEAIEAARTIICSKMSAPETAEFTTIRAYRGKDNDWCVLGSVSGITQYGARSYRRFVVMLDHEGHWKAVNYDFAFYDYPATCNNLLFEVAQ